MGVDLLSVLNGIFNPYTVLIMFMGTALGVIVGAIPGLNGPIGVALMLPFTYGMTPANGLLLLGGIYMGAAYGGSISAILLNCPGTGSAACTAIEGNPLAKQGRAKEALHYAILSSSFGGLLGVLALIFFTQPLVKVALKFGPAEMFLFALSGVTIVGAILGKSPAKGFIAVTIGLIISLVGADSNTIGISRLTFGIPQLESGIPLIPVTVGLFAITEMLTVASSGSEFIVNKILDIPIIVTVKRMVKSWWLLVKSTLIGIVVGILPGIGGAIASFAAYGEAGRSTKEIDTFGNGNPDGIIAAESANNAAVGSSLVPLLAMGIPGSATAAILFGALTLQGLQPGPQLFLENTDMVFTFMFGMLVCVFIMFLIGTVGVPVFSSILKVKLHYLVPTILIFSVIGVYSARYSFFDVGLAIFFGFIGIFFKKAKIPIAPIILGVILGGLVEENLRRCIEIAAAKNVGIINYIFLRPISLTIFVVLVLVIITNFIGLKKQKAINKP